MYQYFDKSNTATKNKTEWITGRKTKRLNPC